MKFQFGSDALNRLGNPPKMRVRAIDQGDYAELQIRPTDRGSNVNMPKDEQLVDINEFGEIEIDDRFEEAVVGAVSLFVAQERKHGWHSVTAVKPTGGDAPVVTRVS